MKNIEILCVDDCSTDNSKELIKNYTEKDNRIKYFYLDENSGPGIARNYGINQSTSEFIVFIDPDDLYANDFALEKLHNTAKKYNIDICGGIT